MQVGSHKPVDFLSRFGNRDLSTAQERRASRLFPTTPIVTDVGGWNFARERRLALCSLFPPMSLSHRVIELKLISDKTKANW